MDRLKFKGVVCPMITPFTVDGSIYKEGIRNLVEFLTNNNINGLFVCGTFGLGPALTIEERKKVLELVIDSISRPLDVIVQVGSTNLEYSLELARHAEDSGADAVASTPPFYYQYDDESITRFFKELVSHLNIPVFIYNIPSRIGYSVSTTLLEKTIDVGVSGMKDSGNDIIKSYDYMYSAKSKNPNFKFLIGTEALMLPAIIAGADGCVSGLSNIYPEVVLKLYNYLIEGKIVEAVNLQFKILKARRILESGPS
ncbi:MAG: dihydrodipicolinate synthase family protein, partial [Aigarchaeota archaeon]|nr:dihydrodipicolinate synthase family protein [Aigarchaeota archaeon]